MNAPHPNTPPLYTPDLLPLDQLNFGHEYPGGAVNVRIPTNDDAERLAVLIEREGLLQPICVVAGPDLDGRFFAVVGGRRLAGLKLLAARGSLKTDERIPVTIAQNLSVADALAKSLIAEESHLPPHPVDRFETFAALRRLGVEIPDIAARHFLEPRAVRQCLALGDLHTDIRAAWRSGEITGEVAQLFTLADDQAHQVKTLDKLREKFGATLKCVGPDTVRKFFTGSEAEAKRLLTFVGRDEYLADGGRLTEDLFAGTDDAPAHVVHDIAKLKKLAVAKLDAEAKRLVAVDGWQWAEFTLNASPPVAETRIVVEPKFEPAERERLDALDRALDAIRAKYGPASDEEFSGAVAGKFVAESAPLVEERDAITMVAALRTYTPAQKAKAGCVVYPRPPGVLCVDHGIVRSEKKPEPAPTSPPTGEASTGDPTPTPPPPPTVERLGPSAKEVVRTVRTAAVSAALRADRHAALAAILASVGTQRAPIAIFAGEASTKSFADSFFYFNQLKTDELVSAVVETFAGRFLDLASCDEHDIATLVECSKPNQYATAALEAFEAKTFLNGCSKDYLLDLVQEALGDDERRRVENKSQKALASFALDSVAVSGWLPPELRGPGYKAPKSHRKNGK